MGTRLKKVSFHSNLKERQCQRMFKLLTIAFILHTSKVMLKILQARLQQYVKGKLPGVQIGFTKGRGHSHQDSMVLAQRQVYRSMEQNRKPRDKSTNLWSPYPRQRRQGYTMEKRQPL